MHGVIVVRVSPAVCHSMCRIRARSIILVKIYSNRKYNYRESAVINHILNLGARAHQSTYDVVICTIIERHC